MAFRDAPPGGDGSAASPYPTIAAAVALGGTVAIAPGTYFETLTVAGAEAIVLLGACREGVVIDGSTAEDEASPAVATAETFTGTLKLSDLTVQGGRERGIFAAGGALHASNVHVSANSRGGISAIGAATFLELTDVAVTGSLPEDEGEDAGTLGYGVAVSGGATLRATSLQIEDVTTVGVWISGATATLTDLEINRVGSLSDDGQLGLLANDAAVVLVERMSVAASGICAAAAGDGTQLTLSDIALADCVGAGLLGEDLAFLSVAGGRVSGTTANGSGAAVGVLVQTEAELDASALVVEDGEGYGIYANNGTLTGASGAQNKPQPVLGKLGQALKFDGSDDYIEINNPGNNTAGSYSLWVKIASNNAEKGWIDSTNADIFQWSGSLLVFRAPGGTQPNISIADWVPGSWHHVAMTWGSGTNFYGYVDGVQVASGTDSGTRTSNIYIGRVDGSYYFNGSIDDVRIYNRALTAAEVLQLYNLGK